MDREAATGGYVGRVWAGRCWLLMRLMAVSVRLGARPRSDNGPARRHLDRRDSAPVQDHEPIAMSGPENPAILAKGGDHMIDYLTFVDGLRALVGNVDVFATDQPNP